MLVCHEKIDLPHYFKGSGFLEYMRINNVQNQYFIKDAPNLNNEQKKGDNTNFKGVGTACLEGVGKFFQVCDDIPMIGVSFTDTVATNVPRTVVDLKEAGIPAAAETARREFSGLFVNCLIPGGFVYGAAKLFNNAYMKNYQDSSGAPINMARTWANGEALENFVKVWRDYTGVSTDISLLSGQEKDQALKVLQSKPFTNRGFVKAALRKIEGLNGVDSWDKLSDHKEILDEVAELLDPVMNVRRPKNPIQRFLYTRERNKGLQRAYETIVNGQYTYKDRLGRKITKVIEEGGGFKASQTLRFDGKNISSDLKNFLRDTADIGNAISCSKEAQMNPAAFAKKATRLVNAKSLMGLAVVIPLAMSMQYINRAITRHKYNKSGAPIYKDFEKEERVLTEKEKERLEAGKPFAVASIMGLAALSMGKNFPKSIASALNMIQFNTKFPSLNQCRLIATSTFASRMLAAEDPNELRESTVRDLASFAGLYFLGDYAEKLAATAIQKFAKPAREGRLEMFNRTKNPDEYKNIIQKFVGWVKDTNIKTFDEIPKEFKNYRSLAKVGGLGFSIALLGVFLPMYNRKVTAKKEAKRKAILEQQKRQSIVFDPKSVFPPPELRPSLEKKIDPLQVSKEKFKTWNKNITDEVFLDMSSKFLK